MTEFNPPISSRDTEQLIAIAHGTLDNWQQEAKDQATQELTKRGISIAQQQVILNEWAEIDKQVQIEIERQRELNAIESYSIGTMIHIFLTAPFILMGKWHVDSSLSELKRENYLKKHRQRKYLLLGGVLFLLLLLRLGAN